MDNVFNFICCGSVDDGKSTLIGRLLVETNSVKKDQLDDALRASLRNGSNTIELSMLLDGLLAEREQQITIDIAHRYFDYQNIRFHILDCPGHKQYTKNMAIGAACTDTALLVIDAMKGISEQTRQHMAICKLFHLKNICCCLTKIDLIPEDKQNIVIAKLSKELSEFQASFDCFDIIPISAVTGYNIDKVLSKIISYAKGFSHGSSQCKILHMHGVRFHQGKRYYYALPMTGCLPLQGERYLVYSDKSNKQMTATIDSVVGYACFQIKEDIDIQQGDVLSLQPLIATQSLHHQTIWFDTPTSDLLIKHGTRTVRIMSHTPTIIQTDKELFVSNVSDVKENALGIIIDAQTKRTIGCAVFEQNTQFQTEQSLGQILWRNDKQPLNTIVFNEDLIKQVGYGTILTLAHAIMKQGYHVKLMMDNPID